MSCFALGLIAAQLLDSTKRQVGQVHDPLSLNECTTADGRLLISGSMHLAGTASLKA